MRKVRVCVAQYSVPEDYEEAIAKADIFCKIAWRLDAKVLLLPELFEGHYFCQDEDYKNFDRAETIKSSETLDHFREIAKQYDIVIPVSFFERAGNCYYNSVATIDTNGKIVGLYRKSHIPTGECYEEKFYFTPGNTGFVAPKTAYGRIGTAICWDQWFPETARGLALAGAEMMLFPTAIGSEPVLPRDSRDHWRNVMIGHAAANMMPVMAANRVGTEKGKKGEMTFYGSSFIADWTGKIVQQAGRDEETALVHEFDLDEIFEERRNWGVFRDRRTDLYKALLSNGREED